MLWGFLLSRLSLSLEYLVLFPLIVQVYLGQTKNKLRKPLNFSSSSVVISKTESVLLSKNEILLAPQVNIKTWGLFIRDGLVLHWLLGMLIVETDWNRILLKVWPPHFSKLGQSMHNKLRTHTVEVDIKNIHNFEKDSKKLKGIFIFSQGGAKWKAE